MTGPNAGEGIEVRNLSCFLCDVLITHQVKYFLNSADEDSLRAERKYVLQKAQRNTIDFQRKMSRRKWQRQSVGRQVLASTDGSYGER